MGDKKLEVMASNLRKQDFPASASQALQFIHSQCHKFSQSGVPSPDQLSSLIEFIDEFIFSSGGRGRKGGGGGGRRLPSLQQLQLIQVLSEYFNSDADFKLLCSVFMIVFMIQGRDIEYKVSILARLLSLALGVNSVAILNFGGVWVTQATPTSTHSLSVANHLVQDYIVTQPGLCSTLKHLPTQSPLFTANLIASIGELHSRVGGEGGEFSPAPKQVVSLVTSWLRSSPSLCDPSSPSLPVTGTSPISSLLAWPVLAPLVGREEEGQALLHHTLVETILSESGQCQVPGQYLTHLARSLHSRLSEGNHSEQAQGLALDRFGQILGAATRRNGGLRPDKELVTLVRDLPRNRLLTIVLSSYI